MTHAFFANVVAVTHLLFIIFVMFGGLLVFWKPWLAWVHIPVVIYGILIEWIGWICPLTPLENRLRASAGQQGYGGGFVEQYLLPLIYPEPLTRNVALLLGVTVLVTNVIIYGLYFLKR